jgi:hypothetical protein
MRGTPDITLRHLRRRRRALGAGYAAEQIIFARMRIDNLEREQQDLEAELGEAEHKAARLEKRLTAKPSAKAGRKSARRGSLDILAFSRGLAQIMREYVERELGAAELRVEKRLAELEQRKLELPYFGVYEPGRSYRRGSFVTRRGSMWCATCDTDREPGIDNDDWLQAVKRGRDGRNATTRREGPGYA